MLVFNGRLKIMTTEELGSVDNLFILNVSSRLTSIVLKLL